MRPLVLALDYGGTKHAAAVASIPEAEPEMPGLAWLSHRQVLIPSGADAEYDQATLIQLARELLGQMDGILVAIGVSFGGPVDGANGVVRLSHHVRGWENVPLRDRLKAEFGVPVAVDNDAKVAALGEWRFGAGQGCDSVLYVTISTGIGGGWVMNGKIVAGADGMAGEIGHMQVQPNGAACPCGRRGCLEAEASGTAIARKFRERRGWNAEHGVTGAMVSRAAQQGDALACDVIDEAARLLGIGLGNAINLVNPQRIVLGGGVTKSGERYWSMVRETARARALAPMRADIQPASLGDDAPLWGAVALAHVG